MRDLDRLVGLDRLAQWLLDTELPTSAALDHYVFKIAPNVLQTGDPADVVRAIKLAFTDGIAFAELLRAKRDGTEISLDEETP